MKNDNVIKVLFDFNILADIDFGIIRFMIRTKHFDRKFFKPEIISSSDVLLKHLVLTSRYENPLHVLLKEEYYSSEDNLYKEVTDKYYKAILQNANPTSIFDLCKVYISAKESGVICSIHCHNDTQKGFIERYIQGVNNYELNTYNMKNYDALFIMKVSDAPKFDNIKKERFKTITLANRACNYTNEWNINLDTSEYFPCLVKTIDIYKDFPLNKEDIPNG